MSIYAKVSQAAVANFKTAVSSAREVGGKFCGALDCLQQISQYAQNQASRLHEVIPLLNNARSTVQKKIAQIEAHIAQLTAIINDLQAELDAVEAEIAVTPASFTRQDSEGNAYEVENPAYTALCAQADALRNEIAKVEKERSAEENHLHCAQAVLNKIDDHHATICEEIDTIEQRSQECMKMISDVESIRTRNAQQTENAYELLEKIEQIISEYIAIKMQIETTIAYDRQSSVSAAKLADVYAGEDWADKVASHNPDNSATCATDDNGKPYRVGDNLIANNKFQINGYEYETDNQGRTIVASGKLQINELGQQNRSMDDAMRIVGKGYQLDVDDRGHLIGHQFNGSDRMENLVPQDSRINRRSFKELEDSLASQVKAEREVYVSVIPFYGADTRRPAGIFYLYKIDGVSQIALFPNMVEEEI